MLATSPLELARTRAQAPPEWAAAAARSQAAAPLLPLLLFLHLFSADLGFKAALRRLPRRCLSLGPGRRRRRQGGLDRLRGDAGARRAFLGAVLGTAGAREVGRAAVVGKFGDEESP